MSVIQSGKTAHDAACNLSEMQRQVAVKNAANQAAVITAEIAHYRNVVASCQTNNNGSGVSAALAALRSLGVNS
jgi:hypothetical protein